MRVGWMDGVDGAGDGVDIVGGTKWKRERERERAMLTEDAGTQQVEETETRREGFRGEQHCHSCTTSYPMQRLEDVLAPPPPTSLLSAAALQARSGSSASEHLAGFLQGSHSWTSVGDC